VAGKKDAKKYVTVYLHCRITKFQKEILTNKERQIEKKQDKERESLTRGND